MIHDLEEFVHHYYGASNHKFHVGDKVAVSLRIKEHNKSRIQIFEGICVAIRGHGVSKTFKVRKKANQIAIEKTFFYHSPIITNIKVIDKYQVRRAKLTFLDNKNPRKLRRL